MGVIKHIGELPAEFKTHPLGQVEPLHDRDLDSCRDRRHQYRYCVLSIKLERPSPYFYISRIRIVLATYATMLGLPEATMLAQLELYPVASLPASGWLRAGLMMVRCRHCLR